MFETVPSYLDRNKTVWTGTKSFADAVGELNAGISAIDALVHRQGNPTTGVTTGKGNVRGQTEEKILEIADQLAALGAKTNDANLAAKVEVTPSSLAKLSDDALDDMGKRGADLVMSHKTALADYGVSDADVKALNALRASFTAVKNAPRTAIAGRAGATATLPDLIDAANTLLRDRVDKLVTKFRGSQPEFVAGYRSARVVVDRGTRSSPQVPTPTPAPAPAVK